MKPFLNHIRAQLQFLLALIRTEPAMIVSAVQIAIGIIVSAGFTVSADRTGAILAFTTALLAAIPAFLARPVGVTAITGLVSAGFTLVMAFGVHGIQPGLVTGVNAGIVLVAQMILRGHLTPVANQPAQLKPSATVPNSGWPGPRRM